MKLQLPEFMFFLVIMLTSTSQSRCEDPSDDKSNLSKRENLRYGPAFMDDDMKTVLYSELDKVGEKIKISKLTELLNAWVALSGNDRKQRYIAAVAIREHLSNNGITVELSLVASVQDLQSEAYIDLIEELKLKLEPLWGLNQKNNTLNHKGTDKIPMPNNPLEVEEE